MKIFLSIAYDGSNYFGWQRQKNAISVQQILEEKLSSLLKKNISLMGASRTDAKVHALDQKATFVIDELKIPIKKIPMAIEKLLPSDIVIKNAEIINDDFHVRHDVVSKTYRYLIFNSDIKNPLYKNYCWHIKNNLDLNKIYRATKFFIGTKDFASFCASGSNVKSTVRTIYDFSVILKNIEQEKFIEFKITGNGFLYNMIRIIIAMIISIGENKVSLDELKKIIDSKDRTLAPRTAPPQGLTLINIRY